MEINIRIRELREQDIWILHKWVNDPEIIKYTNSFRPISEMEQREWMNNTRYFRNNYIFGIENEAEGNILGICGLYNFDVIARNAELRMKIGDRAYHGQGVGTKALKLLLEYGYQNVNLHKIWLKVLANNKAAIRLYENAGFFKEGILREEMFIKGCYHDVYLMSLLENEYS